MALNKVHAGDRLRVLFSASHKAGDLVYEKGFFGWVQDDGDSGDYGVLFVDGGVYELARTPATVAMGTKLYAAPSAVATTLDLKPLASIASGAIAVGRAEATGNATVARVRLFRDNNY
jgi:predicted RecA/RadA family phage recombinase